MQAKSDQQLLREYTDQGSEAAFGEIVARHTDLIYSAASRQTGSPELARDVAQSVFIDLARKSRSLAGGLNRDASLVGWLYRATRFAALGRLRDERRRQNRERQAMEQLHLDSETSSDWTRVGPVLDEAMASLSDADREALLLRFFKNQDFRAVGAALGVSDDAAQKRVARGLEKLRTDLLRRGVTTTAAGLRTVISGNAVQLAPAGLAAACTSVSLTGASVGTESSLTFSQLLAGTKFQVALSAVIAAAVLVPLLLQQRAQAGLRQRDDELKRGNIQVAQLEGEVLRLSDSVAQANSRRAGPDDQLNELLRLRGQVGRLRNRAPQAAQLRAAPGATADDKLAAAERFWKERVVELKDWLDQNPSEKIPELELLTEREWVDFIYPHTFETPESFSRASSFVRGNAENKIMGRLQGALRRYVRENGGRFPADLSQLVSCLESPIDDAILQRYRLAHSTNLVPELRRHGDWVITQKAAVNEALDTRFATGLTTGGGASMQVTNRWAWIP